MSVLKPYRIHFSGYYPVGAVAVVFADCEETAVNTLWESEEFKPHQAENKISYLLDATTELTPDKPVNILLDGNY